MSSSEGSSEDISRDRGTAVKQFLDLFTGENHPALIQRLNPSPFLFNCIAGAVETMERRTGRLPETAREDDIKLVTMQVAIDVQLATGVSPLETWPQNKKGSEIPETWSTCFVYFDSAGAWEDHRAAMEGAECGVVICLDQDSGVQILKITKTARFDAEKFAEMLKGLRNSSMSTSVNFE